MKNIIPGIVLFSILFIVNINASAAPYSGVSINGVPYSTVELIAFGNRFGIPNIAPGNYTFDPQTRCWVNHSNGKRGCVSNTVSDRLIEDPIDNSPIMIDRNNCVYDPATGYDSCG